MIGNILATIFVILNSVPGAYYHIGFPVVNRYVWGMYGSAFVIWNRILLSLGMQIPRFLKYERQLTSASLVWFPSLDWRGVPLCLPHGTLAKHRDTYSEPHARINRNDNCAICRIHRF